MANNSAMTESELINMSDEDFINMVEPPQLDTTSSEDEPKFDSEEEKDEEESTDTEESETEEETLSESLKDETEEEKEEEITLDSEKELEKDEDSEFEKPDDEDSEKESDSEVVEKGISEKASESEKEKDTDSEETTKEKSEKEPKEESESDDSIKNSLEEYNKILAPFKANGVEMQVSNAAEAIQLMQMGANYNKKMQGLSPHLKTLRMLENNGITKPEDINYLIDLHNKKPDAISKLIQDSGHDSLAEENETAAKNYSPTERHITDQEMALTEVLSKIEHTDTYQKTIDVCGNQWDERSKAAIANEPQVLESVNDHMNNGIYDVINSEVQKQRALGNLTGVSDLDAYQKIGDEIQSRGGFNHLFEQKKPVIEKEIKPAEMKSDAERDKKRQEATTTRSTPVKKTNLKDYNPLEMSDEEFEKQFGNL